MKDANALDNIHGSLSDQEGTSGPEGYDEEDSVEEKQDSEPMNDWESTKVKSPHTTMPTPPAVATTGNISGPDAMTPETARKNWNSRFSNIKHTFDTASEEDLSSKSRSPSIHKQDPGPLQPPPPVPQPVDRSRPINKESSRSPMPRPYGSSQMSQGSISPSPQRFERPQSKEDKEKQNSMTYS